MIEEAVEEEEEEEENEANNNKIQNQPEDTTYKPKTLPPPKPAIISRSQVDIIKADLSAEADNIYSEPEPNENTYADPDETSYADPETIENVYADPEDVHTENMHNIYEVPEDVHSEFKKDLNDDENDECASLDEFDDDEHETIYENAETICKEDTEDRKSVKSVSSCETIPEMSTEDEEADEMESRLTLLRAQHVCTTNN